MLYRHLLVAFHPLSIYTLTSSKHPNQVSPAFSNPTRSMPLNLGFEETNTNFYNYFLMYRQQRRRHYSHRSGSKLRDDLLEHIWREKLERHGLQPSRPEWKLARSDVWVFLSTLLFASRIRRIASICILRACSWV